MKKTIPSADYVAPYIVFNVGGNKYRIIALVKFPLKLVMVIKALTHEQYDRWKPEPIEPDGDRDANSK
jgi:mRNA interferase HigB